VADSPVLAGFGAALADAQAIPNAPAMGAVWGPMDRALTTILASQDSDVAAALQRAATAIAAAGSP
jgi:arabinogalactan oligomer/maltooligosaccharide transport system substrate-binding protein